MSKKKITAAVAALLALALLATACGDDDDQNESQLPNPASVYCEEQGGTVEIRTDDAGNQYGFCVFDDGSECDEWAFFRGECSPGQSLGGGTDMANPASVYCLEQGGTEDLATGICTLPDGTQCDEWALYRGECGPEAAGSAVLGGDTQIPNPAAVFCEEQGGTVEIITAADGSQSGVCRFDDGSSCDEWAFFRGDCAPGD